MTSPFDSSRRYRERDETKPCHDDGREIALLHYIFSRPDLESLRGHPERVRDAIDDFAITTDYLMTVGNDKGRVVTDLIEKHKPKVMVELGSYIGYSAIVFGSAMRSAVATASPNTVETVFYSCEMNPEFASIARTLIDLAGLDDLVKVLIGPSDKCIRRLHAQSTLTHIDMMFLDHYKPAYKSDLKLCEELGLISPGTVLAADNVVLPGNPPYLDYVRSSVAEKRRMAVENGEGQARDEERFGDGTARRNYKEYANAEHVDSRGNPNLVYESRLMERWDPTGLRDGLEITRCTGIEA